MSGRYLVPLIFLSLPACSSSDFSIGEEHDPSQVETGDADPLTADGGAAGEDTRSASTDTANILDSNAGDTSPFPSDTGLDSTPATDTTDTAPSATDSAPVDTYIAPLGACSIPTGSVATAASSYMQNAPANAIDGDTATHWQMADYTGSISISFGMPTTFDTLRFAAIADFGGSATNQTYTITGKKGSVSTTIASIVWTVSPTASWSEPVKFSRGTWDSITITINQSKSWVALSEVSIKDSSCP